VKLDLNVEPMTGEDGQFAGAVVVWGISTQEAADALRSAQEAQRDDIDHLNGNLQMVATRRTRSKPASPRFARNAVDVSQAAEKSRTASGESKTASRASRHRAAVWPRWRVDCLHRHADQRAGAQCNIEAARAGAHGKASPWWPAR